MSKLTELGPFSGTGELYQMLDLLRNRELYDKRFEELESLRKRVNESIGKYAKARSIDKVLAQAESSRTEARETLAKAQKQAEEIRNETKVQRQQLQKELEALGDTLRNQKLELARVTSLANSVLGDAQARADELISRATAADKAAQDKQAKATELYEAHSEMKRKLEELIGQLGGP